MRIQGAGEGLVDEQQRGQDAEEEVVYVLHPNCAVDEV